MTQVSHKSMSKFGCEKQVIKYWSELHENFYNIIVKWKSVQEIDPY